MPIESNAATEELSSPYYLENEKLCNKWSEYVLSRNGKINGKFNAWSFMIKSKIESKLPWLIEVEKSTYSNGSLLFSSKYQNLQETLTFKTLIPESGCKDFRIKRARFKGRSKGHKLHKAVVELLEGVMESEKLYEVRFEQNRLTIVFHHSNDWFGMADKVLAFDYDGQASQT